MNEKQFYNRKLISGCGLVCQCQKCIVMQVCILLYFLNLDNMKNKVNEIFIELNTDESADIKAFNLSYSFYSYRTGSQMI